MPRARNKLKCRHSAAYPTIYGGVVGFMWCRTCGATRSIRQVKDNTFRFDEPQWSYPTYQVGRQDPSAEFQT